MFLEDFRHNNNLGKTALQCIFNDTAYSIIPYEEDAFIAKAVQFTLDSLTCLESSDSHLNPGDSSLSAIVLWFLSIESFFAKIVKVICLYTGMDFKSFQKVHICQRIDLICECLGIDKISFQKTAIRNKLQEFNEIRNSIFHSGCFQNSIKVKHTVFSTIPVFMNQSDVIQAADIAVNIMTMFRNVFTNVDIIPTYVIHFPPSRCIKWVALNEFYTDVILKSFTEILEKHELKTNFKPLSHTKIKQNHVIKTDIKAIIKAEPDAQFKLNEEKHKTNIIEQHYIKFSIKECSQQQPDTLKVYNAHAT